MSAIDPHQVRHVARLARLELSDREVLLFAQQLGDVLDYVRELEAVPTADVPPLAQPFRASNILRVDEPTASLSVEDSLANAPARNERGFEVPAVLESGA